MKYGDINTHGGSKRPPCIELAPDALPKVQKPVSAKNSHTGASSKNALSATITKKHKDIPHWLARRVAYERRKKTCDYLVKTTIEAYCPTMTIVKEFGDKMKIVEDSRLPNIFFARGTENASKPFVCDDANLPHLRISYRHFRKGARIVQKPLIVQNYQIEALISPVSIHI